MKTKSQKGLCFLQKRKKRDIIKEGSEGNKMITNNNTKRNQVQILYIDDLVPEDLARNIKESIEFFISV